jgi:hypothetical protein
MKKCKRCGIEKEIIFFGDNKLKKDGKSIYCKECERIRGIEYRIKNRDKVNNSSKKWRNNNPEKYKQTLEKYLDKNPEMKSSIRIKTYRLNPDFKEKEKKSRKEYYIKNVKYIREKRKEYYFNNKIKERLKHNKWKNKKRKEDGFYRMIINLRNRLRSFLIGETKSKRTQTIVGIDKLQFKQYIESKFDKGMSWENYGQWHLDHIKPICSANNVEDIISLNHYTNLQPLWAEDNLKKNRKL